jgi:hypothetical protein
MLNRIDQIIRSKMRYSKELRSKWEVWKMILLSPKWYLSVLLHTMNHLMHLNNSSKYWTVTVQTACSFH